MSQSNKSGDRGDLEDISIEASMLLGSLDSPDYSRNSELSSISSSEERATNALTAEERLFNAAALIYLNDRDGMAMPSFTKSHIGNVRITLRSAEGDLVAQIPAQQAKNALMSYRFGNLDCDLLLLVKRRAEDNARAKEERLQKHLEFKARARSWLMIAKEKLNPLRPTEEGGHKHLMTAGAFALSGLATVWGINFITLQAPLNSVISSDDRNSGLRASASYQWMINPGVLVFSVDEASSVSPADVSRILLQYAKQLEDRTFTSVLLAQKGKPIFLLKGNYFKEIGEEYGVQNVIYTLRTMPENVYEIDGSPAFSSWSGGWLGVIGKQFEDLNNFHRRWLVDEP